MGRGRKEGCCGSGGGGRSSRCLTAGRMVAREAPRGVGRVPHDGMSIRMGSEWPCSPSSAVVPHGVRRRIIQRHGNDWVCARAPLAFGCLARECARLRVDVAHPCR